MKVLFVCNQNQHRSKTAEEIFKHKFDTKSAGLFNNKPLSRQELLWADVIVVMEDFQRAEIGSRFPDAYLQKRIVSWEIPDIFRYRQPELVALFNERVKSLKP